jgi:single-stranded-DNA-specific exonuclease
MLPRLNKRWVIHPTLPEEVDRALGDFPKFFRQILYARGVTDADGALRYLECRVRAGDDDPFQMTDMSDAVDRLLFALDHQETVAVYGDYDVDGVTATALMTEALRAYGGQVLPYIPNRFDEGYGLNVEALEHLAAQGARVVLTVDCGIRSPAEAERAEALGIDLIISDHHHPGSELPDAYAVICPRREGDPYPYKDLAGVGLAYKIAQALSMRRPGAGVTAEDWLDLVALGTVADVAPLTGENRDLVRRGLELMRRNQLANRPGLRSLANVAGVKPLQVKAGDLAFYLGPRLNASGRLKSALDSLNLLLCADLNEAGRISQSLEIQNRERQDLTRQMQDEAIAGMRDDEIEPILFAFQTSFNPGVVGLVAARLVDTYYRPAVVGHVDGEFTRASCRSIPEFHITRALDQCGDLLVRHGGHALAAGFTVRNENLPRLIDRLGEIAAQELAGRDLRPELRADVEIPLDLLNPARVQTFLRFLDRLQPTGQGNPEAVFVTRGLEVTGAWTVGSDKRHLKLRVRAGDNTFDAIAFRQAHLLDAVGGRVDLLYCVELNEYNGRSSLQLNVRDLRPAGEDGFDNL